MANGHKAAGALRKEARLHGEQRLEEACAYALAIRTFALKSLQSILREQPDKRPVLSAQPIPLPLTKTCGVPTIFAPAKCLRLAAVDCLHIPWNRVGRNLQSGWVRFTGTRCQNHQRLHSQRVFII